MSYRIYLLYDNRFAKYSEEYRCYIGYTKYSVDKRVAGHFKEAKNSDKHNKRLNWLRSLCRENISYEILQDNILIEEDALNAEVYYIKKFKEEGLEYALRNGDCGGLGGTKNYSEEVINKIRATKIGNKWNVGKHHSPETLRKISEGNKRKKIKPESIEKARETRRRNKAAGKRITRKNRRFSEEDIIEIFRKYNDEFLSARQIAVTYNCKTCLIKSVLSCDKSYSLDKQKNNLTIKPNRPSGYAHPATQSKLEEIKNQAVLRRAEKRNKFLQDVQYRIEEKRKNRLEVLVSILKMGKAGMLQKDIALKFGIHEQSVSRLVAGRSWAKNLIEEANLKIKNESE